MNEGESIGSIKIDEFLFMDEIPEDVVVRGVLVIPRPDEAPPMWTHVEFDDDGQVASIGNVPNSESSYEMIDLPADVPLSAELVSIGVLVSLVGEQSRSTPVVVVTGLIYTSDDRRYEISGFEREIWVDPVKNADEWDRDCSGFPDG